MATAITNTPVNIQGNFDVAVLGLPNDGRTLVQLQKSLGESTTKWKTIKTYANEVSEIIVNVGNNSFRLLQDVPGMEVEFNQ